MDKFGTAGSVPKIERKENLSNLSLINLKKTYDETKGLSVECAFKSFEA